VLGTVVVSPTTGSGSTAPDDTPGERAPQRTDTTATPSSEDSTSSSSGATQADVVAGPAPVAAAPPAAGPKAKLATVFGERDRTEEVLAGALPAPKTRAVGIAETAPNQARNVATYGFVAAGAAFLLLMSYFADAWRRR
jgi:hypothetical protein